MRLSMACLIAFAAGLVGYCAGHPAGDQFIDGYLAGIEDTTDIGVHGHCRDRFGIGVCERLRQREPAPQRESF